MMIFTATEAADFLRTADREEGRGWHPILPNLGGNGEQVWLSDNHPGVKIERASSNQPFYITAQAMPGWFTKAGDLTAAIAVANKAE